MRMRLLYTLGRTSRVGAYTRAGDDLILVMASASNAKLPADQSVGDDATIKILKRVYKRLVVRAVASIHLDFRRRRQHRTIFQLALLNESAPRAVALTHTRASLGDAIASLGERLSALLVGAAGAVARARAQRAALVERESCAESIRLVRLRARLLRGQTI